MSAMTAGRILRNSVIVITLVLGLSVGLTLGTGSALAQSDDKHPVVVLDTSMGEITIELDPEKAPKTVENFLKYVDSKFYDNLIFHRVIPGFMIQGGGLDANLREKEDGKRAPILNESNNGLSNVRGTIAMARMDDPNSASCQFFINHGDNRRLDNFRGGYAVFGKVIGGLDVVNNIANVETGVRPDADGRRMKDVPVKTILIKTARRKAKSS
jgi:peptidyl-prolyl cis-trans isomerase A (cyclophilin A)